MLSRADHSRPQVLELLDRLRPLGIGQRRLRTLRGASGRDRAGREGRQGVRGCRGWLVGSAAIAGEAIKTADAAKRRLRMIAPIPLRVLGDYVQHAPGNNSGKP